MKIKPVNVKLVCITMRYVEFVVLDKHGNEQFFKKLTKQEFSEGVQMGGIRISQLERVANKNLLIDARQRASRVLAYALDIAPTEVPSHIDLRAGYFIKQIAKRLQERFQ